MTSDLKMRGALSEVNHQSTFGHIMTHAFMQMELAIVILQEGKMIGDLNANI